ncbi:efflux transporter outer membrane subunit [Tundrisphaera sp. TA3]|uniref:efflux transporter outer membrane subunit n=1 Tax=Tundrisphaera sp. TA3 TaxID=3435775 RepID=UPI003EBA1F1C
MNLSPRSSIAGRVKYAGARVIACSLLLLVLPACGIPPLRHPTPAPDMPGDFYGAATPDNSSQVGIEEFYNDRMLTCLIEKALVDNRELRVLNEDVQIAGNEVLERSGAYLPFISVTAGAGLERASRFTLDGAALLADEYLPGKFFNNPHANYLGGLNFTWQLDIYRQLRNARDAAGQRYVAAAERRNYFATRLIADIAENFYRLMALDKRLENLNQIIDLQQRSLEIAQARKEAARSTELGVLRFQAEVQKNQSDKLIVTQSIIEGENRINYLVNRFPQRVERNSTNFYDLEIHPISVGVPSELLQNRPDIRQAERELVASGLDVKVARVNFYPQLVITGGVALQSFNIAHLFEPQAVIGDIAGGLVGPLVNRRGIRAQYMSANARQLQAVYNYQRVILEAFTQVTNRLTMVENYSRSIEIKKQQLESLESAVSFADDLFQNARIEYLDVLVAQRDLRDGRMVLIDTKAEQLSAVVNAYQALGGGVVTYSAPDDFNGRFPYSHTVRAGENFWTISLLYYRSGRYSKALWAANKNAVPDINQLPVGSQVLIPRPDQLDSTLFEEDPAPAPGLTDGAPAPAPPTPSVAPPADPATLPPPSGLPGPFGQAGAKDPAVKAAGDTGPAAPTRPGAPGNPPAANAALPPGTRGNPPPRPLP